MRTGENSDKLLHCETGTFLAYFNLGQSLISLAKYDDRHCTPSSGH